jgi:poly(A) polymerase
VLREVTLNPSPDSFSLLFTPLTRLLMQKFREEGSELRIVGGAVRDCLLGQPPNDIDFSTPALPSDVITWIQQIGLHAIPTGILFGTITAYEKSTRRAFEITTLRRDLRTDGRYASVEFTTQWPEDAARRDFTINALYCDDQGILHDFFGGRKDLAAGRLRFIGNPQKRIDEDHLRILRYFRFWSQFGRAMPETALLRLLEEAAPRLQTLSGERIWKELQAILTTARFGEALWLMRRVLAPILGVICPSLSAYTFWDHPLLQNPFLRLSFFIPSITAYRLIKERLHFSHKESIDLRTLILYEQYDVRRAEERLRHALRLPLQELCSLRLAADVVHAVFAGILEEKEALSVLDDIAATDFPQFPIGGKELIPLGIPPGPTMGQILRETHTWWVSENGQPAQEECLVVAQNIYQSIL